MFLEKDGPQLDLAVCPGICLGDVGVRSHVCLHFKGGARTSWWQLGDRRNISKAEPQTLPPLLFMVCTSETNKGDMFMSDRQRDNGVVDTSSSLVAAKGHHTVKWCGKATCPGGAACVQDEDHTTTWLLAFVLQSGCRLSPARPAWHRPTWCVPFPAHGHS